jgi:threonylcarbamoyladenosine tRNA methylthiotransferase MtaB
MQQNLGNCSYWRNIGDYGRRFGTKKRTYFLSSELDKVEGIERLRISSIEPNLLKNETIEFVSKSRTFVPHFHIPLSRSRDSEINEASLPT